MIAELFLFFLSVLSISYLKVIYELVNSRFHVPSSRTVTTLIPTETESNFWLGLDCFDYSPDSKNGCQGLETTYFLTRLQSV